MPQNVMCKNCNNYRNNWCERVIDSPDPNMVRDCRHFWQRTNADRIRAMSDEELVKNFWEVMDDSKFCTGVCNEQRDCDICRLAWLKQPSEVDNG